MAIWLVVDSRGGFRRFQLSVFRRVQQAGALPGTLAAAIRMSGPGVVPLAQVVWRALPRRAAADVTVGARSSGPRQSSRLYSFRSDRSSAMPEGSGEILTNKTASPLLTREMPVMLTALRNRIKKILSVLLLRTQHRLSFFSSRLSLPNAGKLVIVVEPCYPRRREEEAGAI